MKFGICGFEFAGKCGLGGDFLAISIGDSATQRSVILWRETTLEDQA